VSEPGSSSPSGRAVSPKEALDGIRRAVDPRETPVAGVILLVALIASGTVGATIGVAGLVHPPAAPTPVGGSGLALTLAFPVASSPAPGLYWEKLAIQSSSTGITTALFGLQLDDGISGPITPGAPTPGCAYSRAGTSFGAMSCGASPMGWYAVLYWTGNGTVASAFGGAGPSWTAPTLPVTSAETLVVVSSGDLQHSSDELSVVATGTPDVTGMSGPF
jgi:hypothetical protein